MPSPKQTKPLKAKSKEMVFLDAIGEVMIGKSITKIEWGNRKEFCLLKDNHLQIYRNGEFHDWIISDGDLYGTDYVTV